MALLEVSQLDVRFALRQGEVRALRDVNFTLERGERLGIVGESGAGKSVAAFSLLNLISRPGFIAGGSITFEGKTLNTMSERGLRKVRGNRISMIFQDPMMTLNPVLSIGEQMVECLKAHRRISTREARAIALDKLKQVQIPSPEKRLDQYPHELSGGMRQRIIIAIALLLDPDIIIADEPTTALDVTVQVQILQLLIKLQKEFGMAIILITHNLGIVARMADRLAVMYAGKIVETGTGLDVFRHPRHPYTKGLLSCIPTHASQRQNESIADRRLGSIPGLVPSLIGEIKGCSFRNRCQWAQPDCASTNLDLREASTGHSYRCLIDAKSGISPTAEAAL